MVTDILLVFAGGDMTPALLPLPTEAVILSVGGATKAVDHPDISSLKNDRLCLTVAPSSSTTCSQTH